MRCSDCRELIHTNPDKGRCANCAKRAAEKAKFGGKPQLAKYRVIELNGSAAWMTKPM